nr:aminotransferase class V-fold PLP-dependent enzyme [Bacilli bacterium]
MNNYTEKQARIPILEALIAYRQHVKVLGHVPGHKGGQGLYGDFAHYAMQLAMIDATELPGLDDLFHPQGAIAEAQALAAEAFGSLSTYFLVAGSTAGNLASVLATCDDGDLALVVRHAHQSVWHGLDLARARRATIQPAIDCFGVLTAPSVDSVKEAFLRYPLAKVLIVTSPTYDGRIGDLRALIEVAHAHDALVIVDEAHGVHLPFHPQIPQSAIALGADLIVQSAHKMGTGLTQTGLLHVGTNRVSQAKLQKALRMVQSSSPSYLLLASIDAMRAQLALEGEARIGKALVAMQKEQQRLFDACPSILAYERDGARQDPFKWLIDATPFGFSGFALEQRLREQYGIYAEYATQRHVLFVFSYETRPKEWTIVTDALLELHALGKDSVMRDLPKDDHDLDPVSPMYDALPFHKDRSRWVLLSMATGSTCAQTVTIYPPGIPILLPGEVIYASHIEILRRVLDNKKRVDGLMDGDEGYAIHCFINE